jgi:hypothetical protein
VSGVAPDAVAQEASSRLIWATCGRSWGFRFLLTGELTDPLPVYDRVFADLEDEPAAWRRAAGKVALRFPDPLGRKDAAGRVIPHEFVVSGDLADRIESVEDGRQLVWPRVEAAYARVWDAERPPSAADLGLTDRAVSHCED